MQNDWAMMQYLELMGRRLYYKYYVGPNGNGPRLTNPRAPWEVGGPGEKGKGTDEQHAIKQKWIGKYGLAGSIKTCHQEWSERYDMAIRIWASWVGFTNAPVISDGEHVYVALGNNPAACYTLDGKRVWAKWRKINSATAQHLIPFDIRGASQLVPAPILCDGLLVQCRKNVVRAMDAKTGALKWWRLRAVSNSKDQVQGEDGPAQKQGSLFFSNVWFTRMAVARVPFEGRTVAAVISGDGYLYRLSDGKALFDERAAALPGQGKSDQVADHVKRMAALAGRSY
jgi:hypothetical protein